MDKKDTIRILITGGTIDKEYDPITGELTFARSHLSNMLNQVRCKAKFVLEEIMLKDSLQMRGEDREEILKRCIHCSENRVIVTHGTDTMVETARVLGGNVEGKTVVSGRRRHSLCLWRLRRIVQSRVRASAVQALQPGVYITMNGKIFSWDNMRKVRNPVNLRN